jgi:hypothetical protein
MQQPFSSRSGAEKHHQWSAAEGRNKKIKALTEWSVSHRDTFNSVLGQGGQKGLEAPIVVALNGFRHLHICKEYTLSHFSFFFQS